MHLGITGLHELYTVLSKADVGKSSRITSGVGTYIRTRIDSSIKFNAAYDSESTG